MKTLKDLAEITLGKFIKRNELNEDQQGKSLIVPASIKESGAYNPKKTRNVSENDKEITVSKGDLLMVLTGPNAGNFVQYEMEQTAYISEHIAKITSNDQAELLSLLRKQTKKIEELISKDTMIPRISRKDLENLKID